MENAIKTAEHYVYIENQFFITNSGQSANIPSNANAEANSGLRNFAREVSVTSDVGEYVKEIMNIGSGLGTDLLDTDIVKNRIGQALVERITRAHRFVIKYYFHNRSIVHRINFQLSNPYWQH